MAELEDWRRLHRLFVRKKRVSHYEVFTDADGRTWQKIAVARRIRDYRGFTAKRGEDGEQGELFSSTRSVDHDLSAPIGVADHDGRGIGRIHVDIGLLSRRTWHVEQPGAGEVTGRERSRVKAFLRFGDAFSWLPSRFEFTADGRQVFTARKKAGPPTRFVVDIADPSIDRRLVLATVLWL